MIMAEGLPKLSTQRNEISNMIREFESNNLTGISVF